MNNRLNSHENLRREQEPLSQGVVRIVCGGQSGADRAAVDFACSYGVPYGGWVPRGGWAEDYPDPPGVLALYRDFQPTESDDPDVRTVWNVRDSSATLIVRRGKASSRGVDTTERAVARYARPVLDVDALEPITTGRLRAFLVACGPRVVLNVAGPRESESPGIYELTLALLTASAEYFDRAT